VNLKALVDDYYAFDHEIQHYITFGDTMFRPRFALAALFVIALVAPLQPTFASANHASNAAVRSAVTDARDAALRTQKRHLDQNRWSPRSYER
jgi:hypothetical protein